MQPLVTIFTLAYNAENYIRETIESVLNQDEPNIEYLICDNGSTDGTYAVMQEYAERDSRIRLVHYDTNSLARRIPDIYPEPKGEYSTFLDSDDTLEKNFVSLLYKKAKEYDADIVIGGTKMFQDGTKDLLDTRVPRAFVYHAGERMKAMDFIGSYGCLRAFWGKLYRTEFLWKQEPNFSRDCACLELINGGDTIMTMRLMRMANCIVGVSEATHNYRVRKSSFYTSSKPELNRIKDGEKLFFYVKEVTCGLGIPASQINGHLGVVFMTHVMELLNMISNEEQDKEYVYTFCEAVLNNGLVMLMSEIEGMAEERKKTIEKPILKKVLRKRFSYNSSFDSFLQNIAVFFMEPGAIPQSIKNLYLLMGVFHKNNQYHYGNCYIEKMAVTMLPCLRAILNMSPTIKKSVLNCPGMLRELLEENVADCSVLKLQMLEQYDQGNKEVALAFVKKILEQNPVDAEGIYFGLVLAYELREEALLYILLDLQNKFWPTHDDLVVLVEQITG